MTAFDFQKFKDKVSDPFKNFLSKQDINEVLGEESDYQKDSPISRGAMLLITRIRFSGTHNQGDRVGKKFLYDRAVKSGLNFWIADNLKGKSTIFKIVKFALTGRNRIKEDIKPIFDEIYVEFKIGSNTYTTHLIPGFRLNAKVFTITIAEILIGKQLKEKILFESNNGSDYSHKIQNLFFTQFSYYPLKWTSKASPKTNLDLLETEASWVTYFKSIYLESKDSNVLIYGAQEEKTFQMLLGLELTYAINNLKIKKDKAEFELAMQKATLEISSRKDVNEIEDLQRELNATNAEIERQKSNSSSNEFEIEKLISERTIISNELVAKEATISDFRALLRDKGIQIDLLRREADKQKSEIDHYEREINKAERYKNTLHEFIEVGAFFSNLDITVCPHCNQDVEKSEGVKLDSHECILCTKPVLTTSSDTARHENKIISINDQQERYKEQIQLVLLKLQESTGELNKLLIEEADINRRLGHLKYDNASENRVREINEAIKQLNTQSFQENHLKLLYAKQGELEYRIRQLGGPASTNSDIQLSKLEKTIELYDFAIKELQKDRKQRSTNIIGKLQGLMHQYIVKFGLTSISSIEVADNFSLVYTQNGISIDFESIAEGEKLRTKLAFYLSLARLDIENNFGRHPRFLMIDSPAKEEGDKSYLNGLVEVFQEIEEQFGENIQIFVASAIRELKDASKLEKLEIVEPNSYLF